MAVEQAFRFRCAATIATTGKSGESFGGDESRNKKSLN
jgi:hypothetical protein